MTLFTNCNGLATVHRSGPPPGNTKLSQRTLGAGFWKIIMHDVFFEKDSCFLEGDPTCAPLRAHRNL